VKRWFDFNVSPLQGSERRYLVVLGIALALVTGGYASYQLWLSYSPDWARAVEWLGGAQDLGTSKLQQPVLREASFPRIAAQQRGMAAAVDEAVKGLELETLPVAGEDLELQFAGVNLSSNSSMTNYLLLNIKQQLLKAKAERVRIVYPKTTFKLAETATADGVADELDTVLMTVRDQELNQLPADRPNAKQFLLRVREAGVDTEDRSIYSEDFYSRVAVGSCIGIFIVGSILFVAINRRWPGHGRRTAIIATLLALGAGWNLMMWFFVTLRPNLQRFNVITRVDLSAFTVLADGVYERSAQGTHEVLLGANGFDQPMPLGAPTVMAPIEGGYMPLIPPGPMP